MSTSAVSGVMDYLLTQLPAVVHAVDTNGVVVEGYCNQAPPAPAPIVSVGTQHPDDATAGTGSRQYLALGAAHVEEDFVIPCYIDVEVEGIDEQSTARRKVCLIFDGVVDLVRSDLTLGGNLLRGRYAQLENIRLLATAGDLEAATGRRSILSFDLSCKNFY
jgi:hypothetical protein